MTTNEENQSNLVCGWQRDVRAQGGVMLVQQITNGLTTAHLTPGNCMLLATACREAGRHIVGVDYAIEAAHIETLEAAFRAAAVAGYAQMHIRPGELKELAEEVGGDW